MTSLASAVDHLSFPAPDVESLRFYLTLPMYHEFKNSKNATILQVPYAEALLYLKNTDLRTIGKIFIYLYMKSVNQLRVSATVFSTKNMSFGKKLRPYRIIKCQ